MAALAAPLIGAGVDLIGGLFGSSAAKRGARTIKDAADSAIGAQGNATIGANKAISDATGTAQDTISKAVAQGQQSSDQARAGAVQDVNAGVGTANTVLGTNLAAQQNNLAPYLQTGQAGNTALQNQIANPFKLPTADEAAATPGFQFQLNEGLKGVNQQASAAGALQTGGTLKALTQYGQGVASTYYQNAVDNALKSYTTNTNTALAGVNTGLAGSGMYNQATQNASNQQASNDLAAAYYSGNTGIANSQFKTGLGMTGAQLSNNYLLSGTGQQAQNSINNSINGSNLLLTGAGAQASGAIGAANAWGSALTGAGNTLAQSYYQNGWSGAPNTPGTPGLAQGTIYGGGGQLIPAAPYGGLGVGYIQ